MATVALYPQLPAMQVLVTVGAPCGRPGKPQLRMASGAPDVCMLTPERELGSGMVKAQRRAKGCPRLGGMALVARDTNVTVRWRLRGCRGRDDEHKGHDEKEGLHPDREGSARRGVQARPRTGR